MRSPFLAVPTNLAALHNGTSTPILVIRNTVRTQPFHNTDTSDSFLEALVPGRPKVVSRFMPLGLMDFSDGYHPPPHPPRIQSLHCFSIQLLKDCLQHHQEPTAVASRNILKRSICFLNFLLGSFSYTPWKRIQAQASLSALAGHQVACYRQHATSPALIHTSIPYLDIWKWHLLAASPLVLSFF